MHSKQCLQHLSTAADLIREMQEILDEGTDLQAFIEFYADATDQLTKAVSAAILATLPTEPTFLDGDEPVEPPTRFTLPHR